MKKLICAALCALMLFVLSVPALAESDDRVIRVAGSASVSLAADTATLQIGVNTRKENVQDAQTENAALMNAVIAALYEIGVGEKDVITSQFNVYSSYDYTFDAAGKENRTPYYQVENMLSVTVRDLNKIGAILDAAVNAGANTTYGIAFSSTQENEAYQKALTRAVEDAAGKAAVLATAAGKTLGDLIMMDASQGSSYYGISNVYDAKESAAGSAIVTGDVSVNASVVLEYTFK